MNSLIDDADVLPLLVAGQRFTEVQVVWTDRAPATPPPPIAVPAPIAPPENARAEANSRIQQSQSWRRREGWSLA
jgi:hypothetical protein